MVDDKNLVMIEDITKDRMIWITRRMRRKGLDMSQVWIYSYKIGNRIIHTLVFPEYYKYKLTKPTRVQVKTFDDPIERAKKQHQQKKES